MYVAERPFSLINTNFHPIPLHYLAFLSVGRFLFIDQINAIYYSLINILTCISYTASSPS